MCIEYFYNPYVDLYCVIGTTYAMEDVQELDDALRSMLPSTGFVLCEAPYPDYITPDYNAPQW